IQAVDLDRIELNRLVSHYTDLLRLTKLVLRSIYVQELRSGSRSSYALLVSMNSIFEKAVERGAKEAVSDWSGWTVDGQASSLGLVTGGKRRFTIRPDVVIRNEDGRPIVVGDAKWKLHEPESNSPEPSNEDLYQLIAYELAHDVPGLLFYPEQEGRISSKYHIQRLHELHTVEIPLRSPAKNSESYPKRIKQKIGSAIADIAPMG
ncbi:MAG: restriction endonuclease, partial [Halobacteriales archaeon]